MPEGLKVIVTMTPPRVIGSKPVLTAEADPALGPMDVVMMLQEAETSYLRAFIAAHSQPKVEIGQ